MFQHSFTRAHVWIAAMVVVGTLHGSGVVVACCGIIAVAHCIIGIIASLDKDTEDAE